MSETATQPPAPVIDASRVAEPFAPARAGYATLTEEGVPAFIDLPAGCMIQHARDDAHAPFIRTGDVAVIDLADTELVFGRLYFYRQTRDNMLWQVAPIDKGMKVFGDDGPYLMLHSLNRLKVRRGATFDDTLEDMRKDAPRLPGLGLPILPIHLSDGPLPLDYVQERIIGRAVGVFMPR